MIRTVLDSNVLASGIVGIDVLNSTPGELIRRWRRHELIIVTSDHILQEVERALAKPYFSSRLSARQASGAMQLLKRRTEHTGIKVTVSGIATHPEDDLVLATAISAKVQYLITGDTGLQSLDSFRGVRIMSPARFMTHLPSSE
jgi:uncharacterized protein